MKPEDFIYDMLSLPQEQREHMRKEINSMPVEDEDTITFCDVMRCRLLAPCQLTECPYNIKNTDSLNCVKALKASDKKKPTQASLATALGMPLDTMRDLLNSAMGKMRKASLLEKIQECEGNQFSYVTNAKVCAACASHVESENHKHEVKPGHFIYYCSRSCESRRPVQQIRLEIDYGTDIGEILIVARRFFRRLDTIQATLGVRKTTLLQWYDNLLGVKSYEFGHDAASAVDVLRKSSSIAPEDSFVSLLSIDKASRWWVEYDAKIQGALLAI